MKNETHLGFFASDPEILDQHKLMHIETVILNTPDIKSAHHFGLVGPDNQFDKLAAKHGIRRIVHTADSLGSAHCERRNGLGVTTTTLGVGDFLSKVNLLIVVPRDPVENDADPAWKLVRLARVRPHTAIVFVLPTIDGANPQDVI
jgi:hypothetical protein